MMESFLLISVLSLLCCGTWAAATPTNQNDTTETSTSPPTQHPSTQSTVPTTTLTPAERCMRANTSCEACVKVSQAQCVWCETNKKCLHKNKLIPTNECALGDSKWGVCWLNYKALIIACSVIGGILIIALTVCICCCCCCRKGNKNKWAREDAKIERQKMDRKAKNAEKRAERKAKTDEIRRKYGLFKDDAPYTRFNDEA